ncbi:MAG: DUF1295 domain-containing protein [bacterium]
MLTYLLIVALFVWLYVTFWFFYGQKLARLDVADEAWGLAQPLIVLIAIILTKNSSLDSLIIFLLTTIWGYRLFSHLHKRHIKSPGDDMRYVEMKSGWKTFPRLKAYIYVFLLQGFLMYLLGISSMILIFSQPSQNVLSLIGIIIWIIGIIFEVIADNQLKLFVSNPINKGKIMDTGLWKYSRHPNYFGEVIMWWGIFIFVLLNTGIWWAIISPLTITYLIVFVSGIPLTEKHFSSNPLWEKYKSKTSALIPWPNKK